MLSVSSKNILYWFQDHFYTFILISLYFLIQSHHQMKGKLVTNLSFANQTQDYNILNITLSFKNFYWALWKIGPAGRKMFQTWSAILGPFPCNSVQRDINSNCWQFKYKLKNKKKTRIKQKSSDLGNFNKTRQMQKTWTWFTIVSCKEFCFFVSCFIRIKNWLYPLQPNNYVLNFCNPIKLRMINF